MGFILSNLDFCSTFAFAGDNIGRIKAKKSKNERGPTSPSSSLSQLIVSGPARSRAHWNAPAPRSAGVAVDEAAAAYEDDVMGSKHLERAHRGNLSAA